MSAALHRIMTQFVDAEPEPRSPAERVEKAMQRALDNTTAERAGTPWDVRIPEVESEDDAKKQFVDRMFGDGEY